MSEGPAFALRSARMRVSRSKRLGNSMERENALNFSDKSYPDN